MSDRPERPAERVGEAKTEYDANRMSLALDSSLLRTIIFVDLGVAAEPLIEGMEALGAVMSRWSERSSHRIGGTCERRCAARKGRTA